MVVIKAWLRTNYFKACESKKVWTWRNGLWILGIYRVTFWIENDYTNYKIVYYNLTPIKAHDWRLTENLNKERCHAPTYLTRKLIVIALTNLIQALKVINYNSQVGLPCRSWPKRGFLRKFYLYYIKVYGGWGQHF